MSINFVRFLQELAIINEGVESFVGEKYYMATGDLSNDNSNELESVSYENKPSRAALTAKPGDVIFARMKGTNKVLLITESESDYIFSTGFVVIRSSEKIDKSFLTHYLKSNLFQDEKDKLCTGATQKAINNQNIEKLKFPLPPLAIQKRIAEILDAADALRRKDQELLKKYDELTQGIFIDMFGDPVKNEMGWEVKKLKSICKSINVGFVGVCEPFYTDKDNGVPLIRTGNLGEGFLKLDKVKYVTKEFHDKQKKSILQKNDILIARHGDNGKAVLYNADFHEANCLNIVILRLESTSNPIFMTTLLNHDSLRKWISGKIGGATQKVINTKALYDVPVISVSIQDQNNFGNLIKFVENQKSLAFQELENANSLFETLIQKAFKGELVS